MVRVPPTGMKLLLRGTCAMAIAALGGCSSPSARFQDGPSLSQNREPARASAPAYGRPSGVGGEASPQGSAGQVPYQWNGSPNRIAEGAKPLATAPQALPAQNYGAQNSGPHSPATPDQPPRNQPAFAQAPPLGPSPVAAAQPLPRGSIEVKPGDTLYGLSRQHGVSISALMDTNQLKSLTLQPGQILKLPTASRSRS